MSHIIKVAVVGAGIGQQHVGAYAALPDLFEVAYVCDLDKARAEEAAKIAPGCRAVTELSDVLADPAVELVNVCLPPQLHFWASEAVLKAGKHVICEKPMTGSLAEAERLRALSQSSGKLVIPVFQYRYGRGYRLIHALREQDLLGKAYSLSIETHWQRGADYYSVPWRGTWKGEMGGAVVSHACHAHNLATHLLGPVVEVSTLMDTRVNPIETEDCAAISMRTEQGALVTSSITLGAAGNSSRFRACFEHVTATSGALPYHIGAGDWTFEATRPDAQEALEGILAQVADIRPRFEGQFTDVHQRLVEGTDLYLPTLEEGVHSIELITAIYASARTGQSVRLPLPADSPLLDGWMP
ncbi:Gfo/Idh/MocA family oxidoreductase [uncultured Roseibium sp.]|uniref:Gfo/Idh/MocA family protein n=1 Tax=uncultured Roseibium sp. TaxID=1936171 RepID=UPI0026179542|nr:Gfo/Idh/MocA family oxidoreductase [uncultured Roseibium sp.]